jgi:hypothetical protein
MLRSCASALLHEVDCPRKLVMHSVGEVAEVVAVVPTVHPHFMPFSDQPVEDPRVADDHPAQDEERSADASVAKHVEHLGCTAVVRAVVERQCDVPRAAAPGEPRPAML